MPQHTNASSQNFTQDHSHFIELRLLSIRTVDRMSETQLNLGIVENSYTTVIHKVRDFKFHVKYVQFSPSLVFEITFCLL